MIPDECLVDTKANHLLATLPANVLGRLQPALVPVRLDAGRILHEPGETPSHVHFPTTAIVSLLYSTESGASAEMYAVGRDGVVGIEVFTGGNTTPSRAVVENAGDALRLELAPFRGELARVTELHQVLLLYLQALLTQTSQTAACNLLHSIDQRLCRWLLLRHDRLECDELVMNQELIAGMLGVRRECVSAAAHRLLEAGLIRYRRGRITIVDRPGLESEVCECYRIVRTECDRLLPAG